jgi:hypothetical protein
VKAAVPAILGLVALGGAAMGSTATAPAQPIEKAFARGGRIQLYLGAADYRIRGGSEDKIRVTWQADKGDGAGVRVTADVSGSTAIVRTSSPDHNIHYTIDVPSRSDVEVDLSAGDIELRGIEGSKRVESWAGDVIIEVGKAEQYRQVDASVRAGDISAAPFNQSTGGLFRSVHWTGKGPYSLTVRLFAGDLTLR